MKFLEHEKMKKISDKSQAIGEFIEWLRAMKGWEICTGHEHADGCFTEWKRLNICGLKREEFIPAVFRIEDLLAEYFKIDLKKIEKEKRAMLDMMRKANS